MFIIMIETHGEGDPNLILYESVSIWVGRDWSLPDGIKGPSDATSLDDPELGIKMFIEEPQSPDTYGTWQLSTIWTSMCLSVGPRRDSL